jgi:diguanylate cyclase (GGDEF)-like protein
MTRLINVRTLLLTALTISLLATSIPVALCVVELGYLRDSITKINECSAQVRLVRGVLDKIDQSMVGFIAIALELSDEDRSKIIMETDRQLSDFSRTAESANGSAINILSDEQRTKLTEAIAGLQHSWEEIRDQSPAEITPAEKTYHFLQISDHTKMARDLLVEVDAAVTRAAEQEKQWSFDRLTRASTLLLWMMVIAAIISISASVIVYHFAMATRKAAYHDALTDLPNRTAFAEHLAAAIDKAAKAKENFAVLCIDLDRFKEVNDVFGHAIGDSLLREVARRLHAGAEGAFVARLGGDEFTLIAAEGPQPSTAAALADRLLATVADGLDIDGHRLRTSLSIGVGIYPNDGIDVTTLLGNADAALYRAKAEGRGGLRFFSAEMDKQLRHWRALKHDLRSAIEGLDLVLHYQPEARIDGEIIGFEALIRWYHPRLGLVPPGTFVPLAEESGLIIPIGEWTLREACREAASWSRPLQIAVNVSPVQFRHGDLPGLVHSALLETGLAPDRLEIEITEGVLIGDFSRAVSILRRLKSLGVRIAMDDFGTGYSSLSYLQAFPFDKIKVDRAFISNLDRNAQSRAIVRAVVGLGRALDLPVLAEGVETNDQLAFLSREGCNEMQGYLVGRPAKIENYAEVVGRSRILEPMVGFGG